LANLLDLPGFDFETSEAVLATALGEPSLLASRLSNAPAVGVDLQSATAQAPLSGLERLSDVPIYATDSLVRRASALQLTADARNSQFIGVCPTVWEQMGLSQGDHVRVSQSGAGAVALEARLEALAAGVVRVPAGLEATRELGPLFGPLIIEKA
jgi:NADH-quinone oxidoreductase subunit G